MLKGGASPRLSFGTNSAWGSLENTIGKAHSTLSSAPQRVIIQEIELPVTVYNKGNKNMEIKLRMQITDGINFIEGESDLYGGMRLPDRRR